MTVLRPATPLDAGDVGAILSAWIDETPWMPRIHTRAEDISFAGMMVERGWVTVAEEQTMTGFMAREGAIIHALYVAPDARGQGVGSCLLTEAQHSADHLSLWTFQENTRAQTFYERHGFAETMRTEGDRNDEGLPDILYQWRRTPE